MQSYEPDHALWLATDPVEIVLHAPERLWCPAPYDSGRSGVLWLHVARDLEEIAVHLKEKGVDVLAPVVHSGQRDLLLLRDPEGRRIALFRERKL